MPRVKLDRRYSVFCLQSLPVLMLAIQSCNVGTIHDVSSSSADSAATGAGAADAVGSTSGDGIGGSTGVGTPHATGGGETVEASATSGIGGAGASTGDGGSAGNATPGALNHNERWFTYHDQPIFLVGFDYQQLVADPALDYVAALDQFAAQGINKVRLWTYAWFGGLDYLTPWARSGSLHNLDGWDPSYWARLRDFVGEARERGVMVEMTIFAPYPSDSGWWNGPNFALAWNRAFNVNGAFDSGNFGKPEFYDLGNAQLSSSRRTLADYQGALVDKLIAELAEFDNVYFEISNEFGVYLSPSEIETYAPWQVQWADRAKTRTAHMVAIHAGHDGSIRSDLYERATSIDVFNLRFPYLIDPKTISAQIHDTQPLGRVLAVNETHSGTGSGATDFLGNLDGETQYAWGLFFSGIHTAFYLGDNALIGSPGWVAGAQRLRVLREFAESVRFWELSPVDASGAEYDALISQGPSNGWQVMASTGKTYVAYFWGTPSSTPALLSIPSGNYIYAWTDTRDGSVLALGTMTTSGAASIPAPPPTWNGLTGVALSVRAP